MKKLKKASSQCVSGVQILKLEFDISGVDVDISLPHSWFESNGVSSPKFHEIKIDEYGQFIKLGEDYEVSIDTIFRWMSKTCLHDRLDHR